MKRENGFTLAELLIVVAIIAVLVAISIPIFSSQLEKSREATDLANVRTAYAELMTAFTTEDKSAYDASNKEYFVEVSLKQAQDGWTMKKDQLNVGGVSSSDTVHWLNDPKANGKCRIYIYSEGDNKDKVYINWDSGSSSGGGSGDDSGGGSGGDPDITCILSGTPVTLANGTTKLIDDITTDDRLMTFNFYTGAVDGNYPLYVMKHQDTDTVVVTLTLDNGTILEMSYAQWFFDMDELDYFAVDYMNYQEAIGRNILTVNSGAVEAAKITAASAEERICTSYEIFTEYNKNFVADGVLTLEPDTWMPGVCTINEDLTMDKDQFQADAEEYGLYTYDEFADLMTEEQFEKMKVADVKIAVGKGLISEEEVFDLYREWMPVYDAAINAGH